jgi:hypothetical protein
MVETPEGASNHGVAKLIRPFVRCYTTSVLIGSCRAPTLCDLPPSWAMVGVPGGFESSRKPKIATIFLRDRVTMAAIAKMAIHAKRFVPKPRVGLSLLTV